MKRTREHLITEWTEARDDGPEREALHERLAASPEDVAVAETHERISALLSQARKPQLRRTVAGEVTAALRRDGAVSHQRPVWFFWTGVGAGAAAAILAVGMLMGNMLLQPGVPANPDPITSVAAVSETLEQPAEPISLELCVREHARVANCYSVADRAAWSLTLAEQNQDVIR